MNATQQAAVDIAALVEENERLRKAIGNAIDIANACPMVHPFGPESVALDKVAHLLMDALDGDE